MGADIITRIISFEDKVSAIKEYLCNPITGVYLSDGPIHYIIKDVIFHDEVFYNLKDAKIELINKCKKWNLEGNAVKLKENNEIKWVISAIAPS